MVDIGMVLVLRIDASSVVVRHPLCRHYPAAGKSQVFSVLLPWAAVTPPTPRRTQKLLWKLLYLAYTRVPWSRLASVFTGKDGYEALKVRDLTVQVGRVNKVHARADLRGLALT